MGQMQQTEGRGGWSTFGALLFGREGTPFLGWNGGKGYLAPEGLRFTPLLAFLLREIERGQWCALGESICFWWPFIKGDKCPKKANPQKNHPNWLKCLKLLGSYLKNSPITSKDGKSFHCFHQSKFAQNVQFPLFPFPKSPSSLPPLPILNRPLPKNPKSKSPLQSPRIIPSTNKSLLFQIHLADGDLHAWIPVIVLFCPKNPLFNPTFYGIFPKNNSTINIRWPLSNVYQFLVNIYRILALLNYNFVYISANFTID